MTSVSTKINKCVQPLVSSLQCNSPMYRAGVLVERLSKTENAPKPSAYKRMAPQCNSVSLAGNRLILINLTYDWSWHRSPAAEAWTPIYKRPWLSVTYYPVYLLFFLTIYDIFVVVCPFMAQLALVDMYSNPYCPTKSLHVLHKCSISHLTLLAKKNCRAQNSDL